MKILFVLLLVILFIQAFVDVAAYSPSQEDGGENSEGLLKKYKPHESKIMYKNVCVRRCRKSWRKKICHRACKRCCAWCHSVPPGTYGNKRLQN